jgi:twitching motility protein PilJ
VKWFHHINITRKLALVVGSLLVGFVGIGVAYFAQLQVERGLATRTASLERFADVVNQSRADVVLSESVLKDFFQQRDLTMSMESLQAFNDLIARAHHDIATLEKLAQNEQQQQIISQLSATISAYQRAAQAAAEAHLKVGINEDSGLYKEMRDAARALEEKLTGSRMLKEAAQVKDAVLHILVLQMRRNENDFLSYRDSVYFLRLAETKNALLQTMQTSKRPEDERAQFSQLVNAYFDTFVQLAQGIQQRESLIAAMKQQEGLVAPLVAAMVQVTDETKAAIHQQGAQQSQQISAIFLVVLVVIAMVVGSAVIFLARHLTRSLRRLQSTVQAVTAGDLEARTQMHQDDELGKLGNAFDALLDERVSRQAEIERERAARLAEAESENEALNNSVVALLQAVAQLSQRDLTIKIPVANDVTGPVADALNMLADETAKVLVDVTHISQAVVTASQTVKTQSDTVVTLANTEREQVVQTADQLAAAADAMNHIADLAQTCNTVAEHAIQRTQVALETVTSTVGGINTIRDTIRETEKRIKRLGERSQEISGAVSLINSIAERTHILALNASMHAASAGEAGRGFAVVAEEVQRLAENARQATEQIANLVHNIQTETMDTVTTMNTVISQVVEGSRLAEQASEQMRVTQQTTSELVTSVRQIAAGSQSQAQVSNELRNRAGQIVESTLRTRQQLEEQDVQTTSLLDYASRLVQAVRIFRLPDLPATADAETTTTDAVKPGFEKAA